MSSYEREFPDKLIQQLEDAASLAKTLKPLRQFSETFDNALHELESAPLENVSPEELAELEDWLTEQGEYWLYRLGDGFLIPESDVPLNIEEQEKYKEYHRKLKLHGDHIMRNANRASQANEN